MSFGRKFVYSAVLSVLLSATVLAGAAHAADRVEVQVRKGQIQEKPVLPASDMTDSFSGRYYDKPLSVKPKVGFEAKSPEELVSYFIAVNGKGDPQGVAQLFVPDEQGEIATSFDNPATIGSSVSLMRKAKEVQIDGYVSADGLRYYLVSLGGANRTIVPMVERNGYYYLTSRVRVDTLEVLKAAYRSGQIKAAN